MTSDLSSAVITPLPQVEDSHHERMTIRLSRLKLDARIGAYDIERGRTQPIEISLSVEVDHSASNPGEDLSQVVDYASMADRIREVVAQQHFDLLEALAQSLADALMEDIRINCLTLDIDKLQAPHLDDADHVGISYERRRTGSTI